MNINNVLKVMSKIKSHPNYTLMKKKNVVISIQKKKQFLTDLSLLSPLSGGRGGAFTSGWSGLLCLPRKPNGQEI